MRFSICVIEPEGYKYSHFLYDFCKYICFTIEANGHDCCMVKNKFYSDRINIILGSHNLNDLAIIEQIKRAGKYVIVQSEVLREGGIAGWPDQATFYTIYVPLMRQATAVWDGIESNQKQFPKLGIQAERIPRVGYLSALEEIVCRKKKDIDFLYYGSLTPHRVKLIEELKARGGNVVCIFDEAAIFRNDYIARSRIHLAPNQGTGINYINSRVLYLLNNRGVVVVERCYDQEWVEHCFLSADAEDWADLCMDTLHRSDLEQLGNKYFEDYKKLDMTALFQPLLDTLLIDRKVIPNIEISINTERQELSGSDVKADNPPLPRFSEEKAIEGFTSIVILTHNQLDHTKNCVKSIRKHTPEAYEIIFVDNDSTDGTVKWLKAQVRDNKNCRFIENKEGGSYAKRINQGVTLSQGEYVLLLSNDVVASPGWLDGMLFCLNHSPESGIVGPMANRAVGIQQVVDKSYRTVDYLEKYTVAFRERYRYRRIPCRNLAEFCLLFRRALIEDIGLLDESFDSGNLTGEDFCLSATLAGHVNYIAGDVFVHHHAEQSTPSPRNFIGSKWKIGTSSPAGKKLAVLKARELAGNLYAKGRKDEAVEALIDCIKITPDNADIYYEMIRIFLESKNYAEAWEVVESMPDAAKKNLKGLECTGYSKEGLGFDEEASVYADKMLSFDDKYPAALNLKGVLAYKKDDCEQAAAFFDKAIQADPGYGEAYTNLGVLDWAMDKKEEAFAYLQKGFVLSPAVPDTGALYYSVTSSLDRFHLAEADFQAAVALYPSNKSLSFLYIDILLQQGKHDLAIKQIENAIISFGIDEGLLTAALSVRAQIGPKAVKKNLGKGTASLCMIVKNEEQFLPQCLTSVRSVVDEMIVVDTGSTDRTKDLATVFGARVFDFPWTGDFSAARNYSLSQAEGDWILILDADEVISELDYNALMKLTSKRSPHPLAYSIVTRNYVNEMGIVGWMPNSGQYPEEAGVGWAPSPKVRLFTRRKDIYFSYPVHELLEPSLLQAKIPVQASNIVVHHYGKLSGEQDLKKGEDYYLLGKIKYESDPTNLKFISELAKQAMVLKKYEEAIELWQKLISLLESAQQHSPAYQEMANFADLNPVAGAYMQLSSSYYMSERFDRALETAREGMKYKIAIKEYMMDYVLIEILAGSLENALNVLSDLTKMVPDYPSALLLSVVVCCIQDQQEKAQQYIGEMLQKGLNVTPGLNKVAKQLHLCGKTEQARRILNVMLENKVSDAETKGLAELLDTLSD